MPLQSIQPSGSRPLLGDSNRPLYNQPKLAIDVVQKEPQIQDFNFSASNQNGSQNRFQNFYKDYPRGRGNENLSSDNLLKKLEREYSDIIKMSIEEINRELDNNMSEVIQLLNRRKSLIINKRKKLRSEYLQKCEEMKRYSHEQLT